MKKYLLASALVLSASSAIAGDFQCMYLNITIANKTDTKCTLIQEIITHGSLSHNTQVPESIDTNASSAQFTMHEDVSTSPNIRLTYQCGEGQTITLESRQNMCIAGGMITASVVASTGNLTALASTHTGDYFAGRRGDIRWTIMAARS